MASCKVQGLLLRRFCGAEVVWQCPHRLVVTRLPLTKVVEVETERKPSPASAPELKDEAKKSEEGNDKVSAMVRGMRKAGDEPCTRGRGGQGLPCRVGAGSISYLRILGRGKRSALPRGVGDQVLAAQRRAASHLEGRVPPQSAPSPWFGKPGGGHCYRDPLPGLAVHLVPKPSGCPRARGVPQS